MSVSVRPKIFRSSKDVGRNITISTQPAPVTFSKTISITRSPNVIVMPLGNSVTVTYTISGVAPVTAQLMRTDGASPMTLAADGAQHTVTFTPSLSQLYFINAQDANGTVIDRLEIIVQQSLTAVDPTAAATITTQRSGNWIDTNPATSPWPNGILPGVNDIVSNGWTIKVNARLDGSGNILQCARFLNGGALRIWNDAGTAAAVWMTDYQGKAGSEINIDSTFTAGKVSVLGLRNRPFHANDTGANSPENFSDGTSAYANYWNAFDLRGGNFIMKGTFVTPLARAVGDIAAGATWVDLQAPVVGWAQSFLIGIADTRGTRADISNATGFTDQFEMLIVRGIGPDANGNPNRRVWFVRPTKFAHSASHNMDGTIAVRPWDQNGAANPTPLTPHLICMSRTAGIFTEDPTGIAGLGGQPRAHMLLNGGGIVDCRDALVSHGMGRCTRSTIAPIYATGKDPSYDPKYYRLMSMLTFDLHGPSGGLGYDSTVDTPEFKPGDPANTFGLNGPSHRFVRCIALDPFEDNGQITATAIALAGATTVAISPLLVPFNSGTVLVFSGPNVAATLTANAAIGATSLSVSALSNQINVGAVAQPQLTASASAAQGATSISVPALPFSIPNGTVFVFPGPTNAVLTATANVGSTSISVAALVNSINLGATALPTGGPPSSPVTGGATPYSLGINMFDQGSVGGWAHFFTNYGLYRDCIGFNFFGACWSLSDGGVTRNVFQGNLVARCDGYGEREDNQGLLNQGSGWWVGSYENWFRGNINAAANAMAKNFTSLGGAAQFSSLNVKSFNGNISPGQPGYLTAFHPNSEGISTLPAVWPPAATPANCTAFHNWFSQILQWQDNEGYAGMGENTLYYTVNCFSNPQGSTPSSANNNVMLRQTAWNICYRGSSPTYATYRVIMDTWFCRADYAQNISFHIATDYEQSEMTLLNWDCEGFRSVVIATDNYGLQHDPDQPDPGGVGRYIIRGGRFKCDNLYYAQLAVSSTRAARCYGMNVVIGGDRVTGTAADAVTIIDATGGNSPKAFYFFFNDITHFNDFPYNTGTNLCAPYTFQFNRRNGQNYDVYPWVQNPDQTLPQSNDGGVASSTPQLPTATSLGAPVASITNQTAHDTYQGLPAHRAAIATATALAGSTTISVTALSVQLPSGTVLVFSGTMEIGGPPPTSANATLTATANAGATSLSVSALSNQINVQAEGVPAARVTTTTASGATSLPISALPTGLSSGNVLTFVDSNSNAVKVTLSANAAVGDTSLSVNATSAQIAAGSLCTDIITQAIYQGQSGTGLCWGGKLTPSNAVTQPWIDGRLGNSSGKAVQVQLPAGWEDYGQQRLSGKRPMQRNLDDALIVH